MPNPFFSCFRIMANITGCGPVDLSSILRSDFWTFLELWCQRPACWTLNLVVRVRIPVVPHFLIFPFFRHRQVVMLVSYADKGGSIPPDALVPWYKDITSALECFWAILKALQRFQKCGQFRFDSWRDLRHMRSYSKFYNNNVLCLITNADMSFSGMV